MSDYQISLNKSLLTNNTEAVLEAWSFQSKSPSYHTSEGCQRLQRGPKGGGDVTDGHIRAPIVHHNVGMQIIAGELYRRRGATHIHFSVYFTIRPLWLSCKTNHENLVTEKI